MSDYLITQLSALPNVEVRLHTRVVDELSLTSRRATASIPSLPGHRRIDAAAETGGEELPDWVRTPSGPGRTESSVLAHNTFSSDTYRKVIVR
jgi:hypothetical protein